NALVLDRSKSIRAQGALLQKPSAQRQHVAQQRLCGDFRSRARSLDHQRLGVVAGGGERELVVGAVEARGGMVRGYLGQTHAGVAALVEASEETQHVAARLRLRMAGRERFIEFLEAGKEGFGVQRA